jgi:small subunit ribosomal protein S16
MVRRIGLKAQPSYRLIAADKESPRDGRFLEILGSYNPRNNPFAFDVNEERIYAWMMQGAQPTESVAQLFKSVGLDKRFARVKAGEPLETVLADAKVYYEQRKSNPKTSEA